MDLQDRTFQASMVCSHGELRLTDHSVLQTKNIIVFTRKAAFGGILCLKYHGLRTRCHWSAVQISSDMCR